MDTGLQYVGLRAQAQRCLQYLEHRSRIIRADFIRELRLIDNREYIVKLSDGSEHRSSRTYADQLERWLE
jgi:DNA-binding LytR/AlgR family response regulator